MNKLISIFKKDTLVFFRSPVIWLIFASLSFIAAWVFWVTIDRYVQLQVDFNQMAHPPTVSKYLFAPLVLTLAKMAMIVVAVLSGLSFAHEKQMDTLQYLLMNQKGELHTVLNKFAAQLLPVSIFIVIVFMAILVFNAGSTLELSLVASGVFALILYLIWLISLGLLISLLVNNSAAAVLSCIVVFVGIWVLGQSAQGAEWGKNWILVISSYYHLSQMSLGIIKVSSLWYFLAGTGLNLWFCKVRLLKMRHLS